MLKLLLYLKFIRVWRLKKIYIVHKSKNKFCATTRKKCFELKILNYALQFSFFFFNFKLYELKFKC